MSDITDDMEMYSLIYENSLEQSLYKLPKGWWKVGNSWNINKSSDKNNLIKISELETSHIKNIINYISRESDKYNPKIYELSLVKIKKNRRRRKIMRYTKKDKIGGLIFDEKKIFIETDCVYTMVCELVDKLDDLKYVYREIKQCRTEKDSEYLYEVLIEYKFLFDDIAKDFYELERTTSFMFNFTTFKEKYLKEKINRQGVKQ